MFHELGNLLPAVKGARIAQRGSQSIRLGEEPLTALKILQPHPLHVGGQEGELAKPVVCMSMEGPNKRGKLELPCTGTEWAAVESGAKLATDIVSPA